VSRLRQKLKEYYSSNGSADRVVIDFPQRSYVPAFTLREPETAGELAPVKSRRWRVPALALIIVAALIAGFVIWRTRIARPSIDSLVVLPFANLSSDPQNEYLADGLTEELTNELAQWQDLRVVARTSAFQFKGKGVDVREIGRRLNVDAVLEGSFDKQGDRIRITAQLNRASNGYHLWSRAFEARSQDMMAVQDEMARSIAVAVRRVGKNIPAPPTASTTNTEAHDLYLRANYQFALRTPESLRKSRELFQAAVDRDPSYSNAYRGIARAEIALIHITAEEPRAGLDRGRRALEKALNLDPRDAEAHGQMADLDYVYDWDWPRAEQEFRLAVEDGAQATTHSFYGWALATRGRFEEAHRHFRIAEDLDPLNSGPRTNQVMAFYLDRRYPEAKRILEDMVDSKIGALDGHLLLGLMASAEHDCGQVKTHFEWAAQSFSAPMTKFGLALAAACSGQRDLARQYLAKAAEPSGTAFASPYQLALGYAYLGDKDSALGFLEKSAEAREGQILYLKYDPLFDGIRSDARFIGLEKRVGLDP
jgi:adenylate cyclase